MKPSCLFTALLPGGWRAVADLDQLTSLTFRLAFSETFIQAVNSEVRNTAFLTNNFRGFSLNFAAVSYRNFLSATPQTSDHASHRARSAVQFGGPVLFGPPARLFFLFGVFRSRASQRNGDSVRHARIRGAQRIRAQRHRAAPLGAVAQRNSKFHLPLHLLRRAARRTVLFVGQGFFRNTREVSVDIRPPTIERVWGGEHEMEARDRTGNRLPLRDRRERFCEIRPLRRRRHAHRYQRSGIRLHAETVPAHEKRRQPRSW